MMKSEYQAVDDKVLLGEPLDQGLEDGQLVLDAGGHGGDTGCHVSWPVDNSIVISDQSPALYWAPC